MKKELDELTAAARAICRASGGKVSFIVVLTSEEGTMSASDLGDAYGQVMSELAAAQPLGWTTKTVGQC
jgi:FPC/CPF motif-containing protein YcgG